MTYKKQISIGMLGFGTVGQGIAEILRGENIKLVEKKATANLVIHSIAVKNLHAKRNSSIEGLTLTGNAHEVAADPNVDVVIEVMGGTHEAYLAVKTALTSGKPVITANKALLAIHGKELFKIAAENNVALLYEAAVAGGIPIIKVLREGMDGNRISLLAGIINGTCNYILSRMDNEELPFSDVLKDAQALGYAEADPTFDIEGIDAAHKLTIMASLVKQQSLDFEKVYTEGISRVTNVDLSYAKKMGYQIKHLGIARFDGPLELRVHPALVKQDKLLSRVDGVMNAVWVKGDALGESMYFGAGAGGLPTASAIIADLCEICRCIVTNSRPANNLMNATEENQYRSISEIESHYYLRLNVEDVPGVMKTVAEVMADHDISIECLHQEQPLREGAEATIILTTNRVKESEFIDVITNLKKRLIFFQEPFYIRIFE